MSIERRIALRGLLAALGGALLAWPTFAQAPTSAPVRIGLSAEFSLAGSTSAQAIELGIRTAIEEINARGGVLGGRPIELHARDDRSNPARGVANLKAFAQMPDLVAVFSGRYSPVALEMSRPAHELKVIHLLPWSSATAIVANEQRPSFAFRLSLADSIAMPAMIDRASSIGRRAIGLMLANSSWGRSNEAMARAHVERSASARVVDVEWHNIGQASLREQYLRLLERGAESILLVAGDEEGANLVREIAPLDPESRVPIIAHWGVTGGEFVARAGAENIAAVDFSVIQTFSLAKVDARRLAHVMDVVSRVSRIVRPEDIRSPAGFGHAYDLTHILARAIDLAGTTDRSRVRDALEQVRDYDGLVRRFERPFTSDRHEALERAQVFFARYAPDGTLIPVEPGN